MTETRYLLECARRAIAMGASPDLKRLLESQMFWLLVTKDKTRQWCKPWEQIKVYEVHLCDLNYKRPRLDGKHDLETFRVGHVATQLVCSESGRRRLVPEKLLRDLATFHKEADPVGYRKREEDGWKIPFDHHVPMEFDGPRLVFQTAQERHVWWQKYLRDVVANTWPDWEKKLRKAIKSSLKG